MCCEPCSVSLSARHPGTHPLLGTTRPAGPGQRKPEERAGGSSSSCSVSAAAAFAAAALSAASFSLFRVTGFCRTGQTLFGQNCIFAWQLVHRSLADAAVFLATFGLSVPLATAVFSHPPAPRASPPNVAFDLFFLKNIVVVVRGEGERERERDGRRGRIGKKY